MVKISPCVETAARLPEGEAAADKGAFFGSVIGTLNHIVVADTIWLKRFCAHPAGFTALDPVRALDKPASLRTQVASDLAPLREHRAMLDGWLPPDVRLGPREPTPEDPAAQGAPLP